MVIAIKLLHEPHKDHVHKMNHYGMEINRDTKINKLNPC